MPSRRLAMTLTALIVLVVTASSCSEDRTSSDDASGSEAPSESQASAAGSPDAVPATTVADACAAISPAMQQVPGKGPYKEIVAALEPVVAAGGDPAAVFEGLYQAASKAVQVIGTIDYLDVEAKFDSLIPGVVSTCKSAGAPL